MEDCCPPQRQKSTGVTHQRRCIRRNSRKRRYCHDNCTCTLLVFLVCIEPLYYTVLNVTSYETLYDSIALQTNKQTNDDDDGKTEGEDVHDDADGDKDGDVDGENAREGIKENLATVEQIGRKMDEFGINNNRRDNDVGELGVGKKEGNEWRRRLRDRKTLKTPERLQY